VVTVFFNKDKQIGHINSIERERTVNILVVGSVITCLGVLAISYAVKPY